MRYRDLVEDGHIPGLLVHPDWWEPKHPQEIPVRVNDPIALYRPSPEISKPGGYGDPENLDGGTPPTNPASGDACNTLAQTAIVGETHIVLSEAMSYTIGDWIFVQLDAGGYFVSRITTTSSCPTFRVPFTTEFAGAATAGNAVCIGQGFTFPAVQTFTLTIGDINPPVVDVNGWLDWGGTVVGSIVPDPPLIMVEDGKNGRITEITNYGPDSGSLANSIEIFGQNNAPADPTAQMLFTTFSRIEFDHAGGTLVLDTRDEGNGGEMRHSWSTEGTNPDFIFVGVGNIWQDAHIGNQYQVRFYS